MFSFFIAIFLTTAADAFSFDCSLSIALMTTTDFRLFLLQSFCRFDDYNWDWSLQFTSMSCIKGRLKVMLMKSPRVFHIGEWWVIQAGLNKMANPRFTIKMTSYQYRKSYCGDKTVVRSSYLHNGISYTGKISSLYWIGALHSISLEIFHLKFKFYIFYFILTHIMMTKWWMQNFVLMIFNVLFIFFMFVIFNGIRKCTIFSLYDLDNMTYKYE